MRGVSSQYDNAGVLVTVISAFGRDARVGQVTETDETTRGAPAWRLIRNPSIPCSPGRLRCHSTQRLCDPFTRLKIGQCSDKLRSAPSHDGECLKCAQTTASSLNCLLLQRRGSHFSCPSSSAHFQQEIIFSMQTLSRLWCRRGSSHGSIQPCFNLAT